MSPHLNTISNQSKRVHKFSLRDGLAINICRYATNSQELANTDKSPLPPLLIVHGFGEHMGRYAHVVTLLQSIGFEVWSYDARGHGTSEGVLGVMPADDALVDDLVEVFNYVAEQTGKKPTVVAHSMGGLTAALAVSNKGLKPAALVLSSPALRIRANAAQKILLHIGMALFPDKSLEANAVDVAGISHDEAVVEQYRKDPLIHAKISPRMVNYMYRGGERVMKGVENFTMPTLLMYAGSDRVVDPAGSDDFAQKLTMPHAKVIRYDQAFHEIFNESEPERSRILVDLADWLKKREFMPEFP